MKISWILCVAACSLVMGQGEKCVRGYNMIPFDEEKFSGDWYVVGLSQEFGKVPKACIKARYSAPGEGNVSRIDIGVDVTAVGEGDDIFVVKGQLIEPGFTSVRETLLKDQDGRWEGVAELTVMASDYDQFAVVYSCFERGDPTGKQPLLRPSFQIWSRNQTVDSLIFSTLKTIFIGLDYGIGTRMEAIDNSGC